MELKKAYSLGVAFAIGIRLAEFNQDEWQMAQDAEKWITIHPNGKEHKGRPALIDTQTGEYIAGGGGNLKGKKVNETHKGFEGPKTPTAFVSSGEQQGRIMTEQFNKAKKDQSENVAAEEVKSEVKSDTSYKEELKAPKRKSPLKGSNKQESWAKDIRDTKLNTMLDADEMQKYWMLGRIPEGVVIKQEHVDALAKINDAKFWIDNRDANIVDLVGKVDKNVNNVIYSKKIDALKDDAVYKKHDMPELQSDDKEEVYEAEKIRRDLLRGRSRAFNKDAQANIEKLKGITDPRQIIDSVDSIGYIEIDKLFSGQPKTVEPKTIESKKSEKRPKLAAITEGSQKQKDWAKQIRDKYFEQMGDRLTDEQYKKVAEIKDAKFWIDNRNSYISVHEYAEKHNPANKTSDYRKPSYSLKVNRETDKAYIIDNPVWGVIQETERNGQMAKAHAIAQLYRQKIGDDHIPKSFVLPKSQVTVENGEIVGLPSWLAKEKGIATDSAAAIVEFAQKLHAFSLGLSFGSGFNKAQRRA